MDNVFILCYLNQVNFMHRDKGWQVGTIYDHFPSTEEILDHSCLVSTDFNDVEMAKMLVEGEGHAVRFVYSDVESDWDIHFFETMIIKRRLGEDLTMWDYFITGYADISNRIIRYRDEKKRK